MAIQVMTWVLDHSNATGSERLVLLSLANHAHPDGTNAFAKQTVLAHEAKVSRTTVHYCLSALEAGGAIKRMGFVGRSVNYRVMMDERAGAYVTSEHPTTAPKRQQKLDLDDVGTSNKRSESEHSTGQSQMAAERSESEHSPGGDSEQWSVQITDAQRSESGPLNARADEASGEPLKEPSPLTPTPRFTPPRPPRGGPPARPTRPVGQRQRELARYEAELAEWAREVQVWAPCPGDDLDEVFAASWHNALSEVRATVTTGVYAMWLDGLHVHALTDDGVLVLAIDGRRISWVEDRFGRLVLEAARHVGIDADRIAWLPCTHIPALDSAMECLSADHDPSPGEHATDDHHHLRPGVG